MVVSRSKAAVRNTSFEYSNLLIIWRADKEGASTHVCPQTVGTLPDVEGTKELQDGRCVQHVDEANQMCGTGVVPRRWPAQECGRAKKMKWASVDSVERALPSTCE
jgi:hypothetical protein